MFVKGFFFVEFVWVWIRGVVCEWGLRGVVCEWGLVGGVGFREVFGFLKKD